MKIWVAFGDFWRNTPTSPSLLPSLPPSLPPIMTTWQHQLHKKNTCLPFQNIREYGAFLTMVEFTIRALLCWLQFWLQSTLNKRRVQPTAPFRCYILVGFTSAATMVFSNCSLFYLNYPTQMMFKVSDWSQ